MQVSYGRITKTFLTDHNPKNSLYRKNTIYQNTVTLSRSKHTSLNKFIKKTSKLSNY